MSNTTPFGYPIPAVRKVSALRQRMIEDMTVRNFAPNTQISYLQQVSLFARHFGKSPEQLGPEEIRAYQVYLADQRKVAVGTRIVAVSALRFLYAVTLGRNWTVQLIPAPKKDHRLPVILSPEEVLQLLQAAPSFSHHVIFIRAAMSSCPLSCWNCCEAFGGRCVLENGCFQEIFPASPSAALQ